MVYSEFPCNSLVIAPNRYSAGIPSNRILETEFNIYHLSVILFHSLA